MPPRKRARVSQAASPNSTSQPITPPPAAASPEPENILDDPWTDEEEIGLFKGLMRYKPTGIHKHFHLITLHQYLLENGFIHPRAEHTKPPGIWRKLQTLYNLEALDEREDARQLEKMDVDDGEVEDSEEEDEDAGAYSEAANKIENEEFELPSMEFDKLKWENRLANDKDRRDESPPLLPELNLADAPPMRFTPSFSIEPETAMPRARGRAGTATSTKAKQAASTSTRRSTRQVESAAEEEAEGEEDDEEEGEEDQEESDRDTPATRSTRTRGRPAGQSKTRSRARAR